MRGKIFYETMPTSQGQIQKTSLSQNIYGVPFVSKLFHAILNLEVNRRRCLEKGKTHQRQRFKISVALKAIAIYILD